MMKYKKWIPIPLTVLLISGLFLATLLSVKVLYDYNDGMDLKTAWTNMISNEVIEAINVSSVAERKEFQHPYGQLPLSYWIGKLCLLSGVVIILLAMLAGYAIRFCQTRFSYNWLEILNYFVADDYQGEMYIHSEPSERKTA